MASSSGVVMEGDFMRNAEYTPRSTGQSETDIDKRLGGCLMAVGLGVAAAGFAGRYAFHLWRPLSQVITEAAKKVPSTSFSAYYKGGFEQKMTRREASLVLGIRSSQGPTPGVTHTSQASRPVWRSRAPRFFVLSVELD
ncbi:dnaJ homolog subfamily C member 15 isoform X2 [Carassius gibelio]|uniref:dnaJ homolog subfamily C member 15 isoform X2 n=1 Tax=Carassius gibelio TaxID=101364 RepID=UPI002278CED6|nr:dnaJ homolog subfamily C member 15 isoform X2 [Carassius gibelio]